MHNLPWVGFHCEDTDTRKPLPDSSLHESGHLPQLGIEFLDQYVTFWLPFLGDYDASYQDLSGVWISTEQKLRPSFHCYTEPLLLASLRVKGHQPMSDVSFFPV